MPYCRKCGRKVQNEGALVLHEANCKDDCCKECGGELADLVDKDVAQEQAIKAGFKKYCKECLELY